ncbi:MAG TPA: hypothetical protein V6D20_06610 [Candidatus Obscuribacterales bacterium]
MSPLSLPRWRQYQRQQYPFMPHISLSGMIGLAAVGYAALLRSQIGMVDLPLAVFIMAGISTVLLFLQGQIATDLREKRWRPEGVLTRQELEMLGVGSGCIQLGLAIASGSTMVGFLIGIWVYLGLMRYDFFVPQWLGDRPLLRLGGHQMIMPLIVAYGAAFEGWRPFISEAEPLHWLLFMSFFAGMVLELGQSLGTPEGDRVPIESPSASIWTGQSGAIAWLTVLWLTAFSGLMAARAIAFVSPVALVVALGLLGGVSMIWRFLAHPGVARWLSPAAQVWLIGLYGCLGLVPWGMTFMDRG